MDEFIEWMRLQLEDNQYKGDWSSWAPDTRELIAELDHHLNKLKRAIYLGDTLDIAEHAADVANLCAKAYELRKDLARAARCPPVDLRQAILNPLGRNIL